MFEVNVENLAVDANGVGKSFGSRLVLWNLDLQVNAGQILTIFGTNGSGKTTLVRILAGLTHSDSGSIFINGFDMKENGKITRLSTGVIPHLPILYADLTARENLMFNAKMFRVNMAAERVKQVALRLEIEHRLDHKIRDLSHGFQKRFSFARALLHRPKLLLMDEPESGIDRPSAKLLKQLLVDYVSQGGSVVMTTHSLSWGLSVADEVAILAMGRLDFKCAKSDTTIEDLRSVYDQSVAQ